MQLESRYDGIVIGGGHNGLVTAAYLAKAGKRICVLERRSVLGGACVTESPWPGFKVSTAAYVLSLFAPDIIRDLRLNHFGLKVLPRNPSSFTPLPDGRSLLMGPDPNLNHREISKFSEKDARQFPLYEQFLDRVSRAIEPVLADVSPDPLPVPKTWRKVGISKKFRDAKKLWRAFKSLSALGEDLPEAIELLTGPARAILDRWFESDVFKATLATDAIIGAFAPISAPGSAYVLLHHVMGEAGGARGIWGYVAGGMGGLTDAIAESCVQLGVHIQRDAQVKRIVMNQGRASGVVLADGKQIDATFVASSVDAHWTFEKFLEPTELPEWFRRQVARIDYSSASAKVNVALSELPKFQCADRNDGDLHLRGTIHIGPSLDYLERAYDDAKYGRPSAEPILEITLPSTVDSTLAPPGQHVMSMFVQYAPYRLAEGDWDSVKEKFADRCIEALSQYAPNIKGSILHRQILSPLDLERTFGLTGGNIFQGAMSLHQLFFMRPVLGWSDHRTPLKGLYLCGSASHPGGGVMGICGRNAAREILSEQ